MKKAGIDEKNCVACGCCARVCPRNAIIIHRGVTAKVEHSVCISCGMCVRSCPASLIKMEETV